MDLKNLNIFGIRHLSPRTAYHLIDDIKEKNPKIILIEGPVDCNFLIDTIASSNVIPPFALLCYTEEDEVRSIAYPFGEYSPEYVAIKHAKENNIDVRFIDMPSPYFFLEKDEEVNNENYVDVYGEITRISGYNDYESFWESNFEHNEKREDFKKSLKALGSSLREIQGESNYNKMRENHMVREILKAVKEGYNLEEIYVICGAYHVDGILSDNGKSNLLKGLKPPKVSHTIMPYSNYKLSTYSGYGSGNKAPNYFKLMYGFMKDGKESEFSSTYMAKLARTLRKNGQSASPASVIEGVSLANTLAILRGDKKPNLRDLKDGAISTIGEGEVEGLAEAMAKVEVGNVYGKVIDNENLTPIQKDFYKKIKTLRLSKYLDGEYGEIKIDLREERGKEKSYFLHKMELLGIDFCKLISDNQERGSWKEIWRLKYTPECEIRLVESIVKGTSINQAVVSTLMEDIENNKTIDNVLLVLKKSLLCGESSIIQMCKEFIEILSVDELDFIKLAKTCEALAFVINFGDVRCIKKEEYYPLLSNIFFKAKNIIITQCNVNEEKSIEMNEHIEELNNISKDFEEFLDRKGWEISLNTIYNNLNNSPSIMGYLLNIFLREDKVLEDELKKEISAYFSYGVNMEKSCQWLNGLCYKNVAILCNKEYLWIALDDYIKNLNEEEFKKVLVSLRKALCSFTTGEKIKIGEILSDHWGVNGIKTSIDMVTTKVSIDVIDTSIFDELEEYDFGEF